MANRREKKRSRENTIQTSSRWRNERKDILLPLYIFQTKIPPFEAVVKYLVEERNLGFTQIAKITNRSPKTIWASYNSASKRHPEKICADAGEISIPISIFFKVELSILESLTLFLAKQHSLNLSEIAKLLGKSKTTIYTTFSRAEEKGITAEKIIDEKNIPATIFNEKLGSLEAITKYLKENLGLSYQKISSLLGRNYQTIISSYKNSLKKYPEKISTRFTKFTIKTSVFKNKKLSVLEHIVVQLKQNYNLGFSETARLLARDPRTIWTVYSKASKKIQKIKNEDR